MDSVLLFHLLLLLPCRHNSPSLSLWRPSLSLFVGNVFFIVVVFVVIYPWMTERIASEISTQEEIEKYEEYDEWKRATAVYRHPWMKEKYNQRVAYIVGETWRTRHLFLQDMFQYIVSIALFYEKIIYQLNFLGFWDSLYVVFLKFLARFTDHFAADYGAFCNFEAIKYQFLK